MKLEEAIKSYEGRANLLDEAVAVCDMTDKVEKEIVCRSGKCAAEHRQLAEWLKILKSAKFEYDEAWRTITHPTPDVTYADKQRAQMILDKFKNSLGAMK